jgi:hypothetical protein
MRSNLPGILFLPYTDFGHVPLILSLRGKAGKTEFILLYAFFNIAGLASLFFDVEYTIVIDAHIYLGPIAKFFLERPHGSQFTNSIKHLLVGHLGFSS